MENLSKLLDELTNNASFRKPLTADDDFSQGSDTLFSGFPGDLDQFHSLGRIKRTPKKQSDQEFEIELLSKIDILNDALFEHKVDIDIVKKAYVQIGESIQELSGMILDQHSDIYQRAYSKFQLLREIYSQLDVVVTGTKTRKLKESDIELTQAQIVILFHHMQKLGIVSKKVSNTLLATSIADITGLSSQKIRQALSSVDKDTENIDADFKTTDYHAVNRKIKRLQQNLEEDFSARF
jgi:hypothetical protein